MQLIKQLNIHVEQDNTKAEDSHDLPRFFALPFAFGIIYRSGRALLYIIQKTGEYNTQKQKSTSVYYTERKPKNKKRARPGKCVSVYYTTWDSSAVTLSQV